MDIKDRMAEIWSEFRKRLQRLPTRNAGKGKHRAGRRPGNNSRALLLAARKRGRQARRYARLCAGGKKHRAF